MKFIDIVGKELLFFDGAMGTELQKRGLKPGELPELWNLTHKEEVIAIHKSYLEAGANIITTNTFGANGLHYRNEGEKSLERIIEAAVKNAKEACQGFSRSFVALDLGPTGKLLAPYGDLPFEEAVELYANVVRIGTKAGADLILIETMSDTYEAKAALLAAKEKSSLPVLVSFTFDINGKLLTGGDAQSAMVMAEGLGADVVGSNCGVGPKQLFAILPEMLKTSDKPLMLNPNAGLPKEIEGKTVFDLEADAFAEEMKKLVKLGASIVGGCCGTTPKHIKALVEACKDLKPGGARKNNLTAVSSYGQAVLIQDEPIVIGERINPTGKPLLKEAIKKADMDYICRLGLEQIDNGAEILDVNVGVPGTDEGANIEKIILALQAITKVPLQIDTSNYEAMEKALRIYNGKPLLNSVSGKEESLKKVLPLVKKYGATVVALALDDEGIPEDAEGRIKIAEKIIQRAKEEGISSNNIVIDPLALTVSTGKTNAQVDLAVIEELTKRGIKTVMGVSNISFGLPKRDAINSTFFAMALARGLSLGIINPNSKNMMDTLSAFKALAGLDDGCHKYVEYFSKEADEEIKVEKKSAKEDSLYEAIIKGLSQQSKGIVTKLLETEKPLDIINSHMIPALDFVGKGFEEKRFFLPQLLMSADAAKTAFDVIRNAFEKKSDDKGETIILATVKGDIHDIGKNIVKVLLENYGYDVVDLGKDVEPEIIVQATEKHKAKLVGLSALMTTTIGAMETTIALLRKNTSAKILVGGAVLTKEYAKEIKADDYAANAVGAVNYANEILKK